MDNESLSEHYYELLQEHWENCSRYDDYLQDFSQNSTQIIKEYEEIFKTLYTEASIKEKFYWEYCQLQTYKQTYETRATQYQNKYLGADEITFINRELKFVNKILKGFKVNVDIKEPYIFYSIPIIFDVLEMLTEIGEMILLDEVLFKSLEINLRGKEKFLKEKLKIQQEQKETNLISEAHPRYFKNDGFSLFENLKNELVRERYELADYSFIFRQMQLDDFIYKDIGESAFRNWLLDTYDIEITEPLKTIDNCKTDNKLSTYQLLK